MAFQAPRGTNDILPADPTRSPKWDRIFESHRWLHLERTFADLVQLYGYGLIRTPVFEEIGLFVRSSGETSDIVSKEMYQFTDKGDREMVLKPEGTAPVVRAYMEHSMGLPGATSRLYYVTPIFRYDRPQRGRYRQAHQVGLELIGSPAPAADAEVIEITVGFYQRLGIKNVSVMLNSIGRTDTRERYRVAILAHVRAALLDMTPEAREKAERNPLRILDSKDPAMVTALEGIPPVTDYLEDASRIHFDAVQSELTKAGVPYEISPSIVRGLDYYTDTVFEVQSTSLGAQSSLCGGGRYDNLIKELGGAATPSVGVAMGIERALIVQEAEGLIPPTDGLRAYVVAAEPAQADAARALARELRNQGIAALAEVDEKSMKSQLKAADRAQAEYALILGPDELAKGVITVKNLAEREQSEVDRHKIAEVLRP